ncbi:hypothetical protein PG990_004505 [Apiospora arundinis]|uniref:Transposase n=1 Tax=Apiospora arundinis TaxID=335852 RepID=A0ABR2J4W5_9PEZI
MTAWDRSRSPHGSKSLLPRACEKFAGKDPSVGMTGRIQYVLDLVSGWRSTGGPCGYDGENAARFFKNRSWRPAQRRE